MTRDPNNLLAWLDLETTGLNPHRCSIIQMGIIVTDNDLNEIEAVEWTILPESPVWEEGAQRMHEATGLYARLAAYDGRRWFVPVGTYPEIGDGLVSPREALCCAHALLDRFFPADFRPMLAGNSVHFDWRVLAYSSDGAYAGLARRFFHRHYDASSVMEWSRRTLGMAPRWSRPKGTERPHTALADLRETLADMRMLREDTRRTVHSAVTGLGPPVVEVAELAHVVNNALAPTGHAGERLAALIAECGAPDDAKVWMMRHLERITRSIGKVDAFVREKTRQPAFVPPVKAPIGGAEEQTR